MHMTGMENFNMQSKRQGLPINTSTSQGGSTAEGSHQSKQNMLEAMKGNKKSGNQSLKGNISTSIGPQGAYQGKGPGTAGMESREKKIYEIYASGKSNMGPIGNNQFPNQAPQTQNSFL